MIINDEVKNYVDLLVFVCTPTVHIHMLIINLHEISILYVIFGEVAINVLDTMVLNYNRNAKKKKKC